MRSPTTFGALKSVSSVLWSWRFGTVKPNSARCSGPEQDAQPPLGGPRGDQQERQQEDRREFDADGEHQHRPGRLVAPREQERDRGHRGDEHEEVVVEPADCVHQVDRVGGDEQHGEPRVLAEESRDLVHEGDECQAEANGEQLEHPVRDGDRQQRDRIGDRREQRPVRAVEVVPG
jgi:hypothetical protein